MAKRKSIREWANNLPDGYRQLALRNLDNAKIEYVFTPETIVHSQSEAILKMFIWEDTPEGHDFWDSVYFHFRHGNTLPPLTEDESDSEKSLVESLHSDNARLRDALILFMDATGRAPFSNDTILNARHKGGQALKGGPHEAEKEMRNYLES